MEGGMSPPQKYSAPISFQTMQTGSSGYATGGGGLSSDQTRGATLRSLALNINNASSGNISNIPIHGGSIYIKIFEA